jgi:hypothetical protein
MAADLDAILVGQTGKVYDAPLGTVAPTSAADAWGTGWIDLGTINEDGLVVGISEDTSDIKAWGGGTVRKLITSSEITFAFTCLESNVEVIRRYFRNAPVDGRVELRGGVRDPRAWGFDVVDGDTHVRYVVANGELTERSDITYKADEAIQFAFTVTAYPDDDGLAALLYSDLTSWGSV